MRGDEGAGGRAAQLVEHRAKAEAAEPAVDGEHIYEDAGGQAYD
jgi:hypothetical protein